MEAGCATSHFSKRALVVTFGHLLGTLDHYRVVALGHTLRLPCGRQLFRNRAQRLFALFLLAVGVYLPLALFLPLWVLAIGPLLWGIPHIFASIRYLGHATTPHPSERRKAVYFVAFVWFGISALRILGDMRIYSFHGLGDTALTPEILSLLITLTGLAIILRRNISTFLISTLLLSPLVWMMWTLPLECMGVLLLAHNWIAFYYWIQSARTSAELKTAVASLLIFAVIHGAVFMGLFDGLYAILAPEINLPWAGLNALELGQSIAPWSNHEGLFFHGTVLYAFGQATHYFVWLKAIPEQYLVLQTPASFTRSWRLLQHDFGRTFAGLALGVCMVAAIGFTIGAVWSLANYTLARDFYFALAAGHGYFEIAALPLSMKLSGWRLANLIGSNQGRA